MIAAAIKTTQAVHSMSLDKLPFNLFDLVLVAVIGFGLFRGRKNGMTKEVLPMLQWVSLVVVCGLGYQMAGEMFINFTGWSRLTSYLSGYLALALVIFFIFMVIKHHFGP